jgi:hypothetical protein
MCKTLLEWSSHPARRSRNCHSGTVQAVGDYSFGDQVRLQVYVVKFKNTVNLQHRPEEERKYISQYTYSEMKEKQNKDAANLSQTLPIQTFVALHTNYVPEDPTQVQLCTSRHRV